MSTFDSILFSRMTKSAENISTQRWVAFIAILLFLCKLAAYYLTQSVAVLTDALESTVNVLAGLIGLYSLHIAAKPRDEDHPYGHGKAEFLSAAVEGALVTMAGLIIIYEGITDLIHPNQLHRLDAGIYIIAFTAIVNFIVGTYCIRKGKRNNSIQLVAGGKHLQTDTWSTTGIIVGLALIWYTKLPWLDGVVALFFAGLILYTGYHILRRSIAGIMDEADRQLLQDLISYLNEHRRENWIDRRPSFGFAVRAQRSPAIRRNECQPFAHRVHIEDLSNLGYVGTEPCHDLYCMRADRTHFVIKGRVPESR